MSKAKFIFTNEFEDFYNGSVKKKIGVFDSGVGGLTILLPLLKEFPQMEYFYFGDIARVPYGIRSPMTIKKFSLQGCLYLQSLGVDVIIVACNTASSTAMEFLQKNIRIPIIGVIEPAVEYLFKTNYFKRIGVIGTSATVKSMSYPKNIKKFDSSVKVIQKACPLFVPLVEEGFIEGEITELVVHHYLKDLKGKVDALILACTHYPLLKKTISRYLGEEVFILDSAQGVIETLKGKFSFRGEKGDNWNVKFFVTDSPNKFKEVARIFFEKELVNVEYVEIEYLEKLEGK